MASKANDKILEALAALRDLGLPRAQRNERSALCLLALLDLPPDRAWAEAHCPMIGITPIMEWARKHYGKAYAPNTRETIRRQTIHQFIDAGIVAYNPDEPTRPVNSPRAVYQVTEEYLTLFRSYGSSRYTALLNDHGSARTSLSEKYAKPRNMSMVSLLVASKQVVTLSPGGHSELIRAIWLDFGPRFVPGGVLVYAGDTGEKWGYFDRDFLHALGVDVDSHGKMPDVVIYFPEKNWLILAEAVTSHGPVDPKRHKELSAIFAKSKAGLVYLSAFPDRRTFMKYLDAISWETEVWLADDPTHLIHFNGTRFLGPH